VFLACDLEIFISILSFDDHICLESSGHFIIKYMYLGFRDSFNNRNINNEHYAPL